LKTYSNWFSPPIREDMYHELIHIPSFVSVDVKNSGLYLIQMTGMKIKDASIEPILEISLKESSSPPKSLVSETSQVQNQKLDNSIMILQKESLENESDNESDNKSDNESDNESDNQEIPDVNFMEEYLKDVDDIEEWEPPFENTRILETNSESQTLNNETETETNFLDPDILIETIEERMRQTQLDLERLKHLQKMKMKMKMKMKIK
jgi:hypothetical protein